MELGGLLPQRAAGEHQTIGSQVEQVSIRVHALVLCLLRGTLAAHPQLFCLHGVGRALFWRHSGNVYRMASGWFSSAKV
jgi:hypothetical protein